MSTEETEQGCEGEKSNLHPRSYSQRAITYDKPTAAIFTAAARPSLLARVNDWLNNECVLGYVLLVPALALLLIFVAYPFFFGTYISLTDARIGKPGHFIGLQNFIDLWSDPIFRQTVGNSFFYTIVTTIFKLPLGMLMAILLNQVFPLKRLVRAAVLLPWIIPTVLSTLAWLWMFDSTYSVINRILKDVLNVQGPIWLSDSLYTLRTTDMTIFRLTWPMISISMVNRHYRK
jgi:multiple sugar transport system permease protein